MPSKKKYNESCTKRKNPFKDPGFLWKESEGGGGLVVLLPERYKKKFSKVVVVKPDGKKVKLYFTGFANGDRQHWRSKTHAKDFPRYSCVRAIRNEGLLGLKKKFIHWGIKNPTIRNATD